MLTSKPRLSKTPIGLLYKHEGEDELCGGPVIEGSLVNKGVMEIFFWGWRIQFTSKYQGL